MFFLECDSELKGIVGLLKAVIMLIQLGIPFILILFGTIDLGKAVMAGKEDEMKAAQKLLIKRVIYAIAVFLVATLVTYVFGIIGKGSESEWHDCWTKASRDDAKEIVKDLDN